MNGPPLATLETFGTHFKLCQVNYLLCEELPFFPSSLNLEHTSCVSSITVPVLEEKMKINLCTLLAA